MVEEPECPDCPPEEYCEACYRRWLYFTERAEYGVLLRVMMPVPEA